MSKSRVQLRWNADELLALIDGNTDDALFAAGEILVADATARAPEDTGDLKSSGYVATQSRSTYRSDGKNNRQIRPRRHEAVAGFSAFYAGFLGRGTRKMRARPFMRPALDANQRQLAEKVIEKLSEGLE